MRLEIRHYQFCEFPYQLRHSLFNIKQNIRNGVTTYPRPSWDSVTTLCRTKHNTRTWWGERKFVRIGRNISVGIPIDGFFHELDCVRTRPWDGHEKDVWEHLAQKLTLISAESNLGWVLKVHTCATGDRFRLQIASQYNWKRRLAPNRTINFVMHILKL